MTTDLATAIARDQGDRSEASAAANESVKRQQIMDGAREVFLENGFDGASIGDIVRAAGVSKGTLYAYFPSKESLFVALVFESRRKQAERVFQLDAQDPDIAGVLRQLGIALVGVMTHSESVALLRLVIGAATKFPEAGRAFYEAGPAYGIRQLAHYLNGQSAAGRLAVDDPDHAATQFLDLCKVGLLQPMLMANEPPPDSAAIARTIDSAVAMFLARYAHAATAG